jgi:hypothetical protein
MVTADDHRERVRGEHVGDLGLDVAVGSLRLAMRAVGVTGIHNVQPVEDLQPEIEMIGPGVVGR